MVTFTKAEFDDELNVGLWPRWCAKYCDVTKVIKLGNPIVNQIIKHAPYAGGRKRVLVDVRTQHLELDHYSTSPGWHCDTPDDPKSLHHLYIIGENRTEFKDGGYIPKGHYATYDGKDKHQGVEVTVQEFRLFVRIVELDTYASEGKVKDLKTFYPNKFPIDQPHYTITEEEYYDTFTKHHV